MKHYRIASSAFVVSAVLVAAIALAAQDRWALKEPNGISFAEFKGYESWQMIGSSQPDDGSGCGTSPNPGCIKSIVGNPVLVKAYSEGIPANGKPVPDGAKFAKIEWMKARMTVPYAATVPGKLAEVSFMVKDSKRFPKTHGWGFATFTYDTASDTWKPKHTDADFGNTCHGCHTVVQARDYVFTSYEKR